MTNIKKTFCGTRDPHSFIFDVYIYTNYASSGLVNLHFLYMLMDLELNAQQTQSVALERCIFLEQLKYKVGMGQRGKFFQKKKKS